MLIRISLVCTHIGAIVCQYTSKRPIFAYWKQCAFSRRVSRTHTHTHFLPIRFLPSVSPSLSGLRGFSNKKAAKSARDLQTQSSNTHTHTHAAGGEDQNWVKERRQGEEEEGTTTWAVDGQEDQYNKGGNFSICLLYLEVRTAHTVRTERPIVV